MKIKIMLPFFLVAPMLNGMDEKSSRHKLRCGGSGGESVTHAKTKTLAEAITAKDCDRVEYFLQHGAKPKNGEGSVFLELAIFAGSAKIMKHLLDFGITPTPGGSNLFGLACLMRSGDETGEYEKIINLLRRFDPSNHVIRVSSDEHMSDIKKTFYCDCFYCVQSMRLENEKFQREQAEIERMNRKMDELALRSKIPVGEQKYMPLNFLKPYFSLLPKGYYTGCECLECCEKIMNFFFPMRRRY